MPLYTSSHASSDAGWALTAVASLGSSLMSSPSTSSHAQRAKRTGTRNFDGSSASSSFAYSHSSMHAGESRKRLLKRKTTMFASRSFFLTEDVIGFPAGIFASNHSSSTPRSRSGAKAVFMQPRASLSLWQ